MTDAKDLIKKLESNESSEIIYALEEIRKNYVRKFEKMKDLEQHSVIKILLSFVEHPKFCKISLGIIADACQEKMWVDKIIEFNGMKSIYRVMRSLVNDDILMRACRAVGNIAKCRINIFIENNLIDLIKNIISFLSGSEKVSCKQTAVRTLRILGKDSKLRSIILCENGFTYIANLLGSSDKKLVICSVRALAELTDNCCIEIAKQLLDEKMLKALFNLYNHGVSDIRMYVMKFLKNLSCLESARSFLIRAGGVNLFFQVAVNDKESVEIRKFALLGLCGCLNYMHMWSSYGTTKEEGLKPLVEALNLSVFDDIHIIILNYMLPLALEQLISDILINLNLIPILIQCLMSFVQKQEHHDKIFLENSSNNEDNELSNANNHNFSHSFYSSVSLHNQENTCCMNSLKPIYLNQSCSFDEQKSNSSSVSSNTIKIDENSDVLHSNLGNNKPMYSILHQNSHIRKHEEISTSCFEAVPEIITLNKKETVLNTNNLNFDKNLIKWNVSKPVINNNMKLCYSDHDSISSIETRSKKYTSDFKSIEQMSVMKKNSSKRFKLSHEFSENSQKAPNLPLKKEILRIDNLILSLISRLSFHVEKKSNSYLASESCFSTLMLYLQCIHNADQKAEKILLEIIKNRHSFEKLIINGFVSKAEELLISIHELQVCVHCSFIQSVHKNLISAVRREAESEFGIGTLGHILFYSRNNMLPEQYNTLYAVSKIIHLKSALFKLLFTCNGLEIIFDNLRNSSDRESEDMIVCLCQIYQNSKKANCDNTLCCISQTCRYRKTSNCVYVENTVDITFVVDNGVQVGASREKICKNSEYFSAFLEGYFCEKNQSVVTIHGISAETLTAIFHFLHGCSNKGFCPYINKISFEVLLELVSECEKFLFHDIKTFAEDRLCHTLFPNTAVRIYQTAKIHNASLLSDITLKYMLCLDVSKTDSLQCLKEFLNLGNEFNVLNEIKTLFHKLFKKCDM